MLNKLIYSIFVANKPISILLNMVNYRIKQLIACKGMSMKEFAENIGITPQELGRMANGRVDVKMSTLEVIAHTLDVPVSSLIADYYEENREVTICPHCGGRYSIITRKRI